MNAGKKQTTKSGQKKSKPNATTRSTAGTGFDFEDQVSAWFLLKMLRGEPIPGINATGHQLQTQTEAQGWNIDDLLVTAKTSTGEEKQLAISCKANVQVTNSAIPESFALAAWALWNKTKPFQKEQDGMALVTQGRKDKFDATWTDLKNWCLDSNVAAALAKIKATKKHTEVFESVKNVSGVSASDEETVSLIRHLHVLPLYFQIEGSDQETNAIGNCRGLLQSGELKDAEKLWNALIQKARESRLQQTGSIRLSELWVDLSKDFALKDHPDFSSSWDALTRLTADYKDDIDTSLPNGVVLPRTTISNALRDFIKENVITVAYGNSGCGKSALVKSVLDEDFSDARQVWLGPEALDEALFEAKRTNVGLSHPIAEILTGSPNQQNILVIDAAEHLKPDTIKKAKKLVASLIAEKPENAAWRIVMIGQTQSLDGRLQDLSGTPTKSFIEISEILDEEAEDVLRSTKQLAWLASHDDAVAALRNLRTLHWVIQAQAVFTENTIEVISITAIADKLWSYWTGGEAKFQNLMMRLAEKEASFQRSFPLKDMSIEDADAVGKKPDQLPLQMNSRNRVEFQHDLAADWARFQCLKGMEQRQWSVLAENPLWHNALRMLGQFMLREPSANQKTAWDVAFEEAEKSKDTAPFTADILLDALCLDPLAELFLTQRAGLLFEDHGKRLNRLLRRFHHIATRPGVPEQFLDLDPSLHLYLEEQHRIPIYGRWPCVAKFLAKHKNNVAGLMSPTVAKLCSTWLKMTPDELSPGQVVPYRKEFAEIALASVRALQIAQGKGMVFLDNSEKPLYEAAFQAAPLLSDEVSTWALEMAQRRPLSKDIAEALTEFNRRRVEEHAEKLKNDPAYKKRQERIRAMPSAIFSGRKLPPWPLGPNKRVEQDFCKLCHSSGALLGLMKIKPEIVAEILLATIIEDSPEESYSDSQGIEPHLGLSFDSDGYPTSYWKSPFFQFLQVNPDVALDTLIQLVNFCTERWEHNYGADNCPKIKLNFEGGNSHLYKGGMRVFNWAQSSSHGPGQLYCALSALEKCLCMRIDAGEDVESTINYLLENSNSVSVLGVLVSVGKYSPALFSGPLRCLLESHELYIGDNDRIKNLAYGFHDFGWIRSGELVLNMAREWHFANHHQISLLQTAVSLINSDASLAEFLQEKTKTWKVPSDKKSALELRILQEQLDAKNYSRTQNDEGQEELRFQYSPELERDIYAFENDKLPKKQALFLPFQCEKILEASRDLTDDEAEMLAQALTTVQSEESQETKDLALIAAAAALTVKASNWLKNHPDTLSQTENIIHKEIARIGETREALRIPSFTRGQNLTFAAHAVMHRWMASGFSANEWEASLIRILTSKDKPAVSTIMRIANDCRSDLGARWWRLLQIGMFWSALSKLSPRYDDPPELEVRWNRWLARLRNLKVSNDLDPSVIDPVGLGRRVERLAKQRWKRLQTGKDGHRPFPTGGYYSGLDTHLLQDIFSWLLTEKPEPGMYNEQERQFIQDLWKLEMWLSYEQAEEDDEEDSRTLSQLGYALLEALAGISAVLAQKEAAELWTPIFALGAEAHYAIGHFLDAWFIQMSRRGNTADFTQSWRSMLKYALSSEKWVSGRRWYYGDQLLRQLLGFGSPSFYQREDMQNLVFEMKDLYKQWADKHLAREEDNIAGLCGFLSSKAGASIRLDGLVWLNEALASDGQSSRWRRDYTGNALVEFLDLVMTENSQQLSENPQLREAVMALIAGLVKRQVPAAFPLQERLRHMAA